MPDILKDVTFTRKPPQPARWTCEDEDNLMLEIAEDSRLRSLGIDPDGDSIDIMMQLETLLQALRCQP